MSRGAGALNRSIAALAYRVSADQQAKVERDRKEALLERDQQFQLPMNGVAPVDARDCVWTPVSIMFETFFPGPTQGMRDPDFDTPHFTSGFEVTSANPVSVQVCVVNWTKNEQGDVIGCRVAVTAQALGVAEGDDLAFRGVLHLNFQGWGAPESTFNDDEGGAPIPRGESEE